MKKFGLNALLWRMKYIPRWSLMRATREENLSEHAADCAHIAHVLSLIAKNIYHKDINCENIAIAALYHDASEIITGDMPTPVKYNNKTLKTAYKELELSSTKILSECAPKELKQDMYTYLTASNLSDYEKLLLKAADRLCALIKCTEEEFCGNREFKSAKAQQYSAIIDMNCEEAMYFIENMLPCFEYTLDELITK